MASFSFTLATTEVSSTAETSAEGEIVAIVDLCADGLGVLITQYQDSPRLKSFICGILAPLQEIENVVNFTLTDVLDIETAEGVHLDLIGAIVGEPRAGFSDADYRRALRVRILVNRSDGKAEQMIRVVTLWTDGADVEIGEFPPAAMEITTLDYAADPVRLFSRLVDAKAAGVSLAYIYSVDAADTYTLSGTYDTLETSSTTGLGSTHTATGGDLAGVLG